MIFCGEGYGMVGNDTVFSRKLNIGIYWQKCGKVSGKILY